MEKMIKEELLGSVKKREILGNLPVDLEKLKSLEVEGEEVRVFCSGCGDVSRVQKDAILKDIDFDGNDVKQDEQFILVESCFSCSDGFENPAIKEMSLTD